jgi:hypothetical protein
MVEDGFFVEKEGSGWLKDEGFVRLRMRQRRTTRNFAQVVGNTGQERLALSFLSECRQIKGVGR